MSDWSLEVKLYLKKYGKSQRPSDKLYRFPKKVECNYISAANNSFDICHPPSVSHFIYSIYKHLVAILYVCVCVRVCIAENVDCQIPQTRFRKRPQSYPKWRTIQSINKMRCARVNMFCVRTTCIENGKTGLFSSPRVPHILYAYTYKITQIRTSAAVRAGIPNCADVCVCVYIVFWSRFAANKAE